MKVGLPLKGQARPPHQLCGVLSHGGGGGQARGADTCQIQEPGRGLLNDEVPGVGYRPHPGEAADDSPKVHRRHRAQGGSPHKIQAGGGGGGVVPLHRLGVGAYQQVAVDCGGHQHPLAVFVGALEDHPAHPIPLALVQQEVLAPGGMKGEGTGGRHLVDGLGLQPGGVDHPPALQLPPAGLHPPACLRGVQAGDCRLQVEFCPVAHRRLRQGQAVLPGRTDSRRGGVEGGGHRRGQAGLQGPGLIPGEQGQAGHAVGRSPPVQLRQGLPIRRGEAQHQGAAGGIGHVQGGAELPGQGHAPHIEPGHQGAGQGVVAGVENGGVGLGGAVGHIVLPLQDAHPEPVFGQRKGRGRARDAAADDEDVVHSKTSTRQGAGSSPPGTEEKKSGTGRPHRGAALFRSHSPETNDVQLGRATCATRRDWWRKQPPPRRPGRRSRPPCR